MMRVYPPDASAVRAELKFVPHLVGRCILLISGGPNTALGKLRANSPGRYSQALS